MKTTNHTAWAVLNASTQPICNYSTVLSLDAEEGAHIPTAPIENGQLAAFNHIPDPAKVSVSLGFDGDYLVQDEALAKLEQAVKSTERFSIFSPTKIWRNMTLEHFDYGRAAGAGGHFLEVKCQFVEVLSVKLEDKRASYSPKKATSAKKTNTGQTQPKTEEPKKKTAIKAVSDYAKKQLGNLIGGGDPNDA